MVQDWIFANNADDGPNGDGEPGCMTDKAANELWNDTDFLRSTEDNSEPRDTDRAALTNAVSFICGIALLYLVRRCFESSHG